MITTKAILTPTFIAVVLSITGSQPLHAQAAESAACSTLEITGLQPNTGTLEIVAYTGEEQFMKRPAWGRSIKVTDATVHIVFCKSTASEVAFLAFQDLNGNRKLDMNPLGIPKEPYAASGTPPLFSSPTWKDTKVSLGEAPGFIAVKF